MSSATASVPVVNLDVASADEVVQALIDGSCMYITGHHVDEQLLDEMIEASVRFFNLPRSQKELVLWDGEGIWHGWQPDGAESTSAEVGTPANLVEWYMVNEVESFTKWPTEPANFADVWTRYYLTMRALSSRVVRSVAEGLGLASDGLDAWTDRQFANLCVNHYPAQVSPPLPGQVRLSLHTDESAITVLTATDAPGGLQVRIPNTGVWTPVELRPGTYLVQAGDLIERWTNRRIRASIHRVVNPPPEAAGTSMRDTLVYFHFPALDTVVAPSVARGETVDGEPKFEPIVARDHILARQEKYVVPQPNDTP
ncbi:MAG: hypothetical protein QOJ66_3323 [Ilumatobacteraceae bacterium]